MRRPMDAAFSFINLQKTSIKRMRQRKQYLLVSGRFNKGVRQVADPQANFETGLRIHH